MESSNQPIEQLIANRLAKLDELRELGLEPYPTRYRVEESIRDAKRRFAHTTAEELEAERPEVRLAGRLRAVRGHGKVSFVDLSDGAEQFQLYLRRDDLDETSWKAFKLLDLGTTRSDKMMLPHGSGSRPSL